MSARKIEDMIHEKLQDEAQKNALEFINYLGEDVLLEDEDWCWKAKYNDETVFHIRIGGFHGEPTWLAWSATDFDYSETEIDEHAKKIAWENICTCGKCGDNCAPGRRAVIFGKTFENCCTSSLMFINPNRDGLECLKKLINIRKIDIIDRT
jgi:hypothetical protein